jgi:hypothetical protein
MDTMAIHTDKETLVKRRACLHILIDALMDFCVRSNSVLGMDLGDLLSIVRNSERGGLYYYELDLPVSTVALEECASCLVSKDDIRGTNGILALLKGGGNEIRIKEAESLIIAFTEAINPEQCNVVWNMRSTKIPPRLIGLVTDRKEPS